MTHILEKFGEIWSFIEQKIQTPVPPYFKYVLQYCGYENAVSIASIDDHDVDDFVSEVRSGKVTEYFKSKLGDKDVLEGSNKNMETFDFSRGHRKFLMYIASFLKEHIEEHGFDTFSVSSNSGVNKPAQQSSRRPPKRLSHSNIPLVPSKKILVELPHEDLRKQKDILISKTITSIITYAPEVYVKVNT